MRKRSMYWWTVIAVLLLVFASLVCHRAVVQTYQGVMHLQAKEIAQRNTTIVSLKKLLASQEEEIADVECQVTDLLKSVDDAVTHIRNLTATNQQLVMKINTMGLEFDKMQGAFKTRELELLAEIDRLKKALDECGSQTAPAPPIPGCK